MEQVMFKFDKKEIEEICQRYKISEEDLLNDKNHIIRKCHKDDIKPGATILMDGVQKTVSAKDIKKDSFYGTTIFGDSFKNGQILVEEVIFKGEIQRQTGMHISPPAPKDANKIAELINNSSFQQQQEDL
jgi:tRNA(Ile)-lysidine synthase TilS/MesJ